MIAALALALAGVAGANAGKAISLLNHSAWIEIGAGQTLSQMKPAEIARLRRCETSSMYFEHWDGRMFDQVFLTGISMRNTFDRVEFSQSGDTAIITLFRTAKSAKPAETLYLSKDAATLTQVAPPAGPHIYLRCEPRQQKR